MTAKKVYLELKQGEPNTVDLHLEAGTAYSFIIRDIPTIEKVSHLGIAGIRFSYNSAIFLPDYETHSSKDDDVCTHKIIEQIDYITETHKQILNYPELSVIVTGHTDAPGSEAYNQDLSEIRAKAVYCILTGDRESFGETQTGKYITDKQKRADTLIHDQIRVLNWIAEWFTWPCSHEGNHNDPFRQVASFQDSYNTRYRDLGLTSITPLDVDKDFGQNTWRAVFDCYNKILANDLGGTLEELKTVQSKIIAFVPETPWIGLSVNYPIDASGGEYSPTAVNRRVEIVLIPKNIRKENVVFFQPNTPPLPPRQAIDFVKKPLNKATFFDSETIKTLGIPKPYVCSKNRPRYEPKDDVQSDSWVNADLGYACVGQIFFETGSSKLDGDDQYVLYTRKSGPPKSLYDAYHDKINSNSNVNWQFIYMGYADVRHFSDGNDALSKARAEEVACFMADKERFGNLKNYHAYVAGMGVEPRSVDPGNAKDLSYFRRVDIIAPPCEWPKDDPPLPTEAKPSDQFWVQIIEAWCATTPGLNVGADCAWLWIKDSHGRMVKFFYFGVMAGVGWSVGGSWKSSAWYKFPRLNKQIYIEDFDGNASHHSAGAQPGTGVSIEVYPFWGPYIRKNAKPYPLVARFAGISDGINVGFSGSVGSIYKPKRYPKKIPMPK